MLVGDGSVECGGTYVISSGDTLSRVSERAYGDSMLYGILADANWDALGGDPEHLTVAATRRDTDAIPAEAQFRALPTLAIDRLSGGTAALVSVRMMRG